MRILNGRVITAAIMLAIFASMVGVSLQFPADARMMPLVIGIPGTVLCLIQFISELISSPNEKLAVDESNATTSVALIREFKFFLWFPAFIISILVFGFLITSLVLVFLFLRLDQRESMKLSLSLSVGGAVVLYLVFELILGLPLYSGFIFQWLFI